MACAFFYLLYELTKYSKQNVKFSSNVRIKISEWYLSETHLHILLDSTLICNRTKTVRSRGLWSSLACEGSRKLNSEWRQVCSSFIASSNKAMKFNRIYNFLFPWPQNQYKFSLSNLLQLGLWNFKRKWRKKICISSFPNINTEWF